jgi:hypothetical protein
MPANHLDHEEGVVLVGIAELIEVAEEKNGSWPELEEPSLTNTPSGSPIFTERVMWTMVGLLGVVTVYGVTKGDKEILMTVLVLAGGALLRLAGLTPKTRDGDLTTNDPKIKGPSKRRRKPD